MFDAAYPPPVVGGKEKQAHLLAKALNKNQVNVDILTLKLKEFGQPNVFEGINVIRIGNTPLRAIVLLFYIISFRLKKNVLHIHTPSKIGIFVLLVSKLLGFKTLFKLPNENMVSDNRGFWRKFWLKSIHFSDIIIVLENDSYNKLKEMGMLEHKIFKVFNGVEMKDLAVSEKEFKQKNILFIGRLVEQKGCVDLLKACSKVSRLYLNDSWHLYIVGDGPLKDELEKEAKLLGVWDKVSFVGFQSDIMAWLKQAYLVVLPSHKEGMSNVVLEAMSMGVPVIASDVGNNKEMVGDDFLFPPGRIDALVENIVFSLDNEEQMLEYGKLLYERCKNKYDINVIAKEYYNIYQKLFKD